MNILIVGCGRVGRRLVHVLERLGHDVSVLDEDAANLALLNELEPPFSGMAVAGVPIDGDVLRSAGIEACDAVAAVTKDDNINLMVAQIIPYQELLGNYNARQSANIFFICVFLLKDPLEKAASPFLFCTFSITRTPRNVFVFFGACFTVFRHHQKILSYFCSKMNKEI